MHLLAAPQLRINNRQYRCVELVNGILDEREEEIFSYFVKLYV